MFLRSWLEVADLPREDGAGRARFDEIHFAALMRGLTGTLILAPKDSTHTGILSGGKRLVPDNFLV